jgi:hypothetical protein
MVEPTELRTGVFLARLRACTPRLRVHDHGNPHERVLTFRDISLRSARDVHLDARSTHIVEPLFALSSTIT